MSKRRYGTVRLNQSARLLDQLKALSQPVHSAAPLTMEELGQGYGFVLYKTHVRGPREELPIVLQDVHDRAYIFADGVFKGVQYRNDSEPAVRMAVGPEGCELAILVENMGRINYGFHLMDRKGITEGVRLGQAFVYQWDCYPLPLDDLTGLKFQDRAADFDGTPQFLRGEWLIDGEPEDTFVKLPGFQKGVIFVNGRALSRYWAVGPQRSAYLPAPFLHRGVNELIVLELEGRGPAEALLDDHFDLGSPKAT